MKADTMGRDGHGRLLRKIKALRADSQELADEAAARLTKGIDRQFRTLLWACCSHGTTLLPGGWILAARPSRRYLPQR